MAQIEDVASCISEDVISMTVAKDKEDIPSGSPPNTKPSQPEEGMDSTDSRNQAVACSAEAST